ncbi:hypothetical protein B5G38_13720 [Gemmiger sp. An87]|nr:hypothetical protein B5G38_13720 [Gemmiger sp. An87]
MKKRTLVLLALVPVAVGFVVNFTLFVPVVGPLLFFLLPLATTVFWVYLGGRYACAGWNAPCAILIGNAMGLLSLAVYVWQYVLLPDENVNLFLAAASQMFSAATPTYLFGRLAMLFESQPNYIGEATALALQVIAVLYMIAVFGFGYAWEKRKAVHSQLD